MTAAQATCPSCAEAERNPRTGFYHAQCAECQARAIAHRPEHNRAMLAKRMTPEYISLLVATSGSDPAARDALHRRVKAWSARIDGAPVMEAHE
jgi:hypothetical protein